MKKQTIKLNESQLRNIIKESVKKVLNEEVINYDPDDYDDLSNNERRINVDKRVKMYLLKMGQIFTNKMDETFRYIKDELRVDFDSVPHRRIEIVFTQDDEHPNAGGNIQYDGHENFEYRKFIGDSYVRKLALKKIDETVDKSIYCKIVDVAGKLVLSMHDVTIRYEYYPSEYGGGRGYIYLNDEPIHLFK